MWICVVVQSVRAPTPNMDMIDRILIQASHAGLDTMLCISKADLGDEESIAALLRPYEIAGYPHVITSAISGLGIDELARAQTGRHSKPEGASGVGKYTQLNAASPDINRAVGGIMRAVRRHDSTGGALKLPFGVGCWYSRILP